MNSTIEQQLQGYDAVSAPPRFDEADVAYVVDDTPVGRILFARNDSGALVASRYLVDPADEDAVLDRLSRAVSPRVIRLPGRLDEARRQMDEFLHGRRHAFDLAVDLALATPFQRSVLMALSAGVGYGEQATYGALATAIDRPTASRAVGAALGANPVCIVVPCHRVVGASGSLTGYAGGLAAKRYLLDLEQSG